MGNKKIQGEDHSDSEQVHSVDLVLPGSVLACGRSPDWAGGAAQGCRPHTEQLVQDQVED